MTTMTYVLVEHDDMAPTTIAWTERLRVWIMWVLVSIGGAAFGIGAGLLCAVAPVALFGHSNPFMMSVAYTVAAGIGGLVLGTLQGVALQHMDNLQTPGIWGPARTRRLPALDLVAAPDDLATHWSRLTLIGRWRIAGGVAGVVVGCVFPGFGARWLDSLADYAVNVAHAPHLLQQGGVILGLGAGAVAGAVQWAVLRDRFAGALVWIPLYGGAAALAMALSLANYIPYPYGPSLADLDGPLAGGMLLAFGFLWMIGGAALAVGLRPPDGVAFGWKHDHSATISDWALAIPAATKLPD